MTMPGDDTTVAAIRIRPRQTVSLMIGPPEHPEDDQKAVEELLDGGGKTIVCAGTTRIWWPGCWISP